jgi:alpha-D-xyloside xylohydrolase
MIKKKTIPVVCFALLMSYCTSGNVDKLADGLLIHVKQPVKDGARQVKLQVVTDRIIHVSASPGDEIASTPSLMAVSDSTPSVAWSSEEKGDTVLLKTASITARVSLTSGQVVFTDSSGQPILQEAADGSKTFSPVTIDGKALYRIRQVFDSPADEAFYGLGQHQTGLMNYKGQDVDLTQYNSIAAVPFLVSSRHYGILWDNYSITRFGDDRPYEQLGSFTLYNKAHQRGGLSATYADRQQPDKVFLQQEESKIDISFLSDLKTIPAAFQMDKGKATWEGFIEPATDGVHKFFMTASGYIKVWIDGTLVLDKWREGWNPGPSVFQHALHKGQQHALKVEWIPESNQAFVSLKWLSPTPEAMRDKWALSSEAGEKTDYYFVYGKNADEVISGYRHITGRATLVPKWALGFWQSRERYKTQQEIEQTVGEFRKRKIPLDNIVLDWSYWKEDAWGSQEFDPGRFPDPAGMISRLHQQYNTHFMISVWPKFYEGIDNYRLFDEKGWLYKQNIKDRQRDWIGKGYVSTFYDAYNADARQLFWSLLNKNLFSKGVDAWWLDATEPDVLSNASIAHRKALMNPTALGPADQYFNGYALMNAGGIYEGQRQAKPNQRVFILTRSAYAGIQRYAAATWSGDIASRFDELARQIPAGINFSLSGLPYWTTDIGGFYVEDKYDQPAPQGADLQEWRELNTRWFQYGAFCPLFRSHGQFPYREIFNIAPENSPEYQSMLYYNQLRYRLMPYIYSLAGATYHKDYTIMRGLIMDFAADTAVRNIKDQFMFGPSLLVNPVYSYQARQRELYLPANTGWYELYSGRFLNGGAHINADAPLQRMPLYVKEGSIVPYGPALQYTAEKAADTITLYVYSGRDAQFTLYEDEGLNYNYEQGQFSRITLAWNEGDHSLRIGRREGSFPGMLQQRSFRVIKVSRDKARELDLNQQADQTITYTGEEKTVLLQ